MAIQQTVVRGRILTERYMPLSVVIKKPGERVPDGRGGYTYSEGSQIQTKGRITDMSAEERISAERMTESVEGVCVLPFGTNVQSSDSLEISGENYAIRGIAPQTPQYQPHLRVLVSRV